MMNDVAHLSHYSIRKTFWYNALLRFNNHITGVLIDIMIELSHLISPPAITDTNFKALSISETICVHLYDLFLIHSGQYQVCFFYSSPEQKETNSSLVICLEL